MSQIIILPSEIKERKGGTSVAKTKYFPSNENTELFLLMLWELDCMPMLLKSKFDPSLLIKNLKFCSESLNTMCDRSIKMTTAKSTFEIVVNEQRRRIEVLTREIEQGQHVDQMAKVMYCVKRIIERLFLQACKMMSVITCHSSGL
ncbi:MAG: hypothetical protein EOP06_04005 [Proteobacteria bacterium]|nr:MAG: hypothetical protein EOP06_04005 [Pseudomonadota bacterium]